MFRFNIIMHVSPLKEEPIVLSKAIVMFIIRY